MRTPWLKSPALRWEQALDFTGPRIRPSPVSWALLALGVTAVIYASDQVDQNLQAREESQATLKRLERGQHQMAIRATPSVRAASQSEDMAPALSQEGWRHVNQIVQWLAFDWEGVLDRMDRQALAEQVVLTQFSLDLGALGSGQQAAPELKLQAAVRDDAHALNWLGTLGSHAGLLSRDKLDTPFSTAHGEYMWRVGVVINGGRP